VREFCLWVSCYSSGGLFVVLSFGFLRVSLARFSLLVILLYTSCVLRGALCFL
jgi:hypothetical protein